MNVVQAIEVVENWKPGGNKKQLREAVHLLERTRSRAGAKGFAGEIHRATVRGRRALGPDPVRPAEQSEAETAAAPSASPGHQQPGGAVDFAAPYGIGNMPTGGMQAETGPIGGYVAPPDAFNLPEDVARNQAPGFRGYHENDEYEVLRGLTTESLTRFQEQMYALGLTTQPEWGEIDNATRDGLRTLMTRANRHGETWQQSLARIATSPDGGMTEERDPFRHVEQEYLPPDPTQIRGEIKRLADEILGEDVNVSDEELDHLRGEFERLGQQQFEAEEEQRLNNARAEYDAGAPVAPGTEEVITQAEGVQPVNAAEQFREYFEDRYSATIARGEAQEQEVERREVTDANLGTLMQIATGGR